jgi:hypothetical protein
MIIEIEDHKTGLKSFFESDNIHQAIIELKKRGFTNLASIDGELLAGMVFDGYEISAMEYEPPAYTKIQNTPIDWSQAIRNQRESFLTKGGK